MKKILAGIMSLVLCGALFTACGKENEETVAEETTSVTTTVTEVEVTTAVTTEAAKPEIEHKYDNIEDFAKEAFSLETEIVTAEESPLRKYMEKNLTGKSLFFDMYTPDESMKMIFASTEKDGYCLKMESDEENSLIYCIDNVMYMLDPSTKTGFSMKMDGDLTADFSMDEMLGVDLEAEIENADDTSEIVTVEIGGEVYTFENEETVGMLFDEDGDIYAIVNGEPDGEIPAFIINEFSDDVPAEYIGLPTDYEIIDMDGLLSGLDEEDNGDDGDSSEPAKTEFASMDEFLKADLSKFEGEEYNAEDSMTADVVRILTESPVVYLSSNYGGEQLTVAFDDDRTMLEGEFGDAGEMMKIIFVDNKLYAIMDSEKAAYVTSDDVETIEELKNSFKESFMEDVPSFSGKTVKSAEVTIAGEKYIIEFDDSVTFSTLIFDSSKKLCGMIDDGKFTNWIITDEIPEGIFDIPSDYEIIDIDSLE